MPLVPDDPDAPDDVCPLVPLVPDDPDAPDDVCPLVPLVPDDPEEVSASALGMLPQIDGDDGAPANS